MEYSFIWKEIAYWAVQGKNLTLLCKSLVSRGNSFSTNRKMKWQFILYSHQRNRRCLCGGKLLNGFHTTAHERCNYNRQARQGAGCSSVRAQKDDIKSVE